jgi:putative chitinase
MINAIQLQKLNIGLEWLPALNETFARFVIATPRQQASFIGQTSHECNNFKTLQENLNYKAETLNKLWPQRFSMDVANAYAHQPIKIANKVYANRMGNRDEQSGDGWRFHGRGCIQLTGHDSYYHCGQALGVDLVSNPDLVADPKYAALSAGWFWSTHNLNVLADAGNDEAVTKKINGGTFGLAERIALTRKAYAVLIS